MLLTCQPRPPKSSWLSRHTQTRHCVGYLWSGGTARARATHARRAALASVGTCPMETHCTGDKPLSFGARRCFNVLAVAFNEQPAFAAHASAPLRWLSTGRRRSASACDARAPCRASCGRYMSYGRALHRRDASLPRCKTVLQRASGGLQRAAGFRGARKLATALAVRREQGAARTLATRERRAALDVIGPCPTKVHCTGEKPLSLGARPCFDVPDAAFHERPPFAWRTQTCHCVGCLWGAGAARALATRARRAALAVVGPCLM